MKVFISWSGTKSHKVALALRDWLPSVIQSVAPYVSSEDIQKGTRWGADIAKELKASCCGIFCITRENLNAPWMNFEAGALWRSIDNSNIMPFMFNLKSSDIHGPFSQFQYSVFEKEDVLNLVKSINKCSPTQEQLKEDKLINEFDALWLKLNDALEKITREPESRPQKMDHPLEGCWQSEWKYGSEMCSDLLELEQINGTGGTVLGRRTAKIGVYEHYYEINGYRIGECMYLTARNCNVQTPIGATLVLKAEGNFGNCLSGIAIRPAGTNDPTPPMNNTLFHKLDFWAGLVNYVRVCDLTKCGDLGIAHRKFPTG